MHDGLDVTTVIFAVLAVFVVWKLKSVLGARVDIEKRPPGGAPSPANSDGNVVRLPGAADRAVIQARQDQRISAFAKTDKAKAGLAAVSTADASFDAARFISGAKVAYEMIIGAFANGDRAVLGNLLSPEVLASFVSVIEQREKSGEQASTKLVSIDGVDVVDGAAKDGYTQISVRIAAKMINVVHDKSGTVISGDAETIVSTDDLWTFSHAVASSDPTWRLIATESEHH